MNNNHQAVKDLFSDLPEGSLKVLQITDTHLYAGTDGTLLGMNTQKTLEEVLLMTAECGPIDLILSTGDLVHDASQAGYERFQKTFEPLNVPVYCLPGNHDVPSMMRNYLVNSSVQYLPSAQHNQWLFIFLDSSIADSEGGHLSKDELSLLESSLQQNPDKKALVCLHHHPVPVKSTWMDTMQLDNSTEFFKIIDQYSNVQGILWGHIHQIYDQQRLGVKLMATPSTCIQFTPEKQDFGLDSIPPGCRWLALLPDGEIRSLVTRLQTMPDGLDVHSEGY